MFQPEEIPTQGELHTWISTVKSVRNRALLSTLYLTGARINEILNRLKKSQIVPYIQNDKEYAIFKRVFTEKNRKHPLRNLPMPIFLEEERRFYIDVQKYIKGMNPDTILFEMSSVNAWYITERWLRRFKERSNISKFLNGCHYFRHCRNTHLFEIYDFSEYDLQQWNGWSSTAPAGVYIHLKFNRILKNFDKRKEI